MSTTPKSSVTRRSVVKGAAWAVPAVTVAGTAPALAASDATCSARSASSSATATFAETSNKPPLSLSGSTSGELQQQLDRVLPLEFKNTSSVTIPADFSWGVRYKLALNFSSEVASSDVELSFMPYLGSDIAAASLTNRTQRDDEDPNSNDSGTYFLLDVIYRFELTGPLPPKSSVLVAISLDLLSEASPELLAALTSFEGSPTIALGSYDTETLYTQTTGTGTVETVVTDPDSCTGTRVATAFVKDFLDAPPIYNPRG